jgi:hypothetical protein
VFILRRKKPTPPILFFRFIWNFFRLENEHLNNCGKFRAVRDISVAPLDASDQQQIIKLMDEPDPRSIFRFELIDRFSCG